MAFSVAQHCVLVVDILKLDYGVTEKAILLKGLLHDAAEAYMGDVIRPVKNAMPTYKPAEKRLLAVIVEKFTGTPVVPPVVKKADDMALFTERRDVLGIATSGEISSRLQVGRISPDLAKNRFLDTFRELYEETQGNGK